MKVMKETEKVDTCCNNFGNLNAASGQSYCSNTLQKVGHTDYNNQNRYKPYLKAVHLVRANLYFIILP